MCENIRVPPPPGVLTSHLDRYLVYGAKYTHLIPSKPAHGICKSVDRKLEDLTVLKRSPDLLNNVKIGQDQLRLIMKHILYNGGCGYFGQVT